MERMEREIPKHCNDLDRIRALENENYRLEKENEELKKELELAELRAENAELRRKIMAKQFPYNPYYNYNSFERHR